MPPPRVRPPRQRRVWKEVWWTETGGQEAGRGGGQGEEGSRGAQKGEKGHAGEEGPSGKYPRAGVSAAVDMTGTPGESFLNLGDLVGLRGAVTMTRKEIAQQRLEHTDALM